MVDRLTGNTTYYVPISANIALGEVHIDSGLEGANQPKMDEQVKTWLTNLEFTRFAEAMGYSELEDISKHMGGLQKLDELVEGNVYLQGGGSILKLEQLINDKAPMSLFYCASTVGDGGNGHATNVSIAYNQTDCTWEVSFHNTGAGLNQATSIRNAEKCMCQCAYTFSELNDQQLRQLVRGILYIQKVETDEKYNSKCRDLYDGLVTYEKTDDSGETETVFVKKPNDPIHNYTFMRAQVGGNCTYASLNAMMRYLVLRKYGALNEASRGSENGKRASNAARVLDFFCRMKSMELAFENVKKGVCGPGEIRFLERILEANVCYFQKYIERRSKPEASDELAKIRSKFNDYRKEIHGAKIQCGINTSDSSSIEEGNLQNTHREIVEALPAPAEVKVYNARTTAVDPKLKELNNKLVEIRNIVAQGTPQATREAVKELAALCAAHTDSNYGEYIGNMVRSLVLNENFQVNIGEALGKDNTLCHGSLEDYYKIVKFLYALKEKNSENDTRGYYYPFSYYFKANSEESLSVDEQNVILTLQAHSLQIFRELVKRRDAAASRQVKLDPTEFVIDVPEIDGNDHVYDKRTVDRREKLRAFSCPNPVNGKFVVGGSGTPMCPNSVKAVFDSLLSGKDHADLLYDREQLQTNISETERTIKSSLEQLTNCRKDIIRAQRKDDVLINLNETKQKLQSQLAKLLEDKAASEIQAKRNDKLARIAELQKAIKDLESQKKNLEEDRAKAQMRQKFFPKSAKTNIGSNFTISSAISKALQSHVKSPDFIAPNANKKEKDIANVIVTAFVDLKAIQRALNALKPVPDRAVIERIVREDLNVDGLAQQFVEGLKKSSPEDHDTYIDDFVDNGGAFGRAHSGAAEKADQAVVRANGDIDAISRQLAQKRQELEKTQKEISDDSESELSQKLDRLHGAIEQIETKITEVERWPSADQIGDMRERKNRLESSIGSLLHLHALQKAAEKEFFTSTKRSSGPQADFNDDDMGDLRQCALERIRVRTIVCRKEQVGEVDAAISALVSSNNTVDLSKEFSTIVSTAESILSKGTFGGQFTGLKASYGPLYSTTDAREGPKLGDIMTSSTAVLDDNWGQNLQIDRSILDFDIKKHLQLLRKIPSHGNQYAITMANAVGFKPMVLCQTADGIFNKTIKNTSETKWLFSPTPYAICGLGDLAEFVAFNSIFQSLRGNNPQQLTHLNPHLMFCNYRSGAYSSNVGSQFAPVGFKVEINKDGGGLASSSAKYCSQFYGRPDPAFGFIRDKGISEEGRNQLIVSKNSTNLMSNLEKCDVMDKNNPLDLVVSVLGAIGNDPSSFVNLLKGNSENSAVHNLVMRLLTSPRPREIISNGIKTEADAQKLVDVYIKFLNQTWLNSPSMRPFDPGTGDQKHILTYNPDRLKAMAVCVTAVTEVLTMLGQGDRISHDEKTQINNVAQKALENILDSLNEKILFQNVKGEGAEDARRQVAQLKLYLASQQSKLVGGTENLSSKWCANVIASLAECGNAASGRWNFSEKLIGVELRHFCSEFAIGFSKHANAINNGFFVQHTCMAARDIIVHSRQLPEATPDDLSANEKSRITINYENNDDADFVEWDYDSMCFKARDGQIICGLINGTSDIAKKNPSSGNIESLIGDKELCGEICKFLGVGQKESVKVEEVGPNTIKIVPTSGIYKGKEFIIIKQDPPVFKRADGMQLLTIDPKQATHHLFRDYFCWGIKRDGKVCYEFCKRTGGREVAYCAIKEKATGQISFASGGLDGRQTIDADKEIVFLNVGDIPGLSHLAEHELKLDCIFHKKDGIIELTAFQCHGQPIKLQKKDDKWVLASNPNMQLISHNIFAHLLQGERSGGLGNTAIAGTENPMGPGNKYLVFQENGSSLTSSNFLFLIPEEVQDRDEVKKCFEPATKKAKSKERLGIQYQYGLLGRTEPSKLSFDEDTLTVQSHFLRWSMDKVGRYGEFSIPESDSKTATHTAITLIARAMREKNYVQAIGFLNAIPNGLMLGKDARDNAIRKAFLDIIRDNFDHSPTASAIHMHLLLKWLQMDTDCKDFVLSSIYEEIRGPKKDESFTEDEFSELIKRKFTQTWREEAFYPAIFALTHLQKKTLLEKLPRGLFWDSGSHTGRANGADQWKTEQENAIDQIARKHSISKTDDTQPASVLTRIVPDRDVVSEGERNAFSILRNKFSSLNPTPRERPDALEGEDAVSGFTFLGTEQLDGGSILKGESQRYEGEISAGREKALEEMRFIPRDEELTSPYTPQNVRKALTECNESLKQQQSTDHAKLQKLYGEVFSTHIASGTIPSENMMPVLIELMLNREKPPVNAGGGAVVLDFPAQKIHVTMSRDQYDSFLTTARSYFLTTSILQKNELIEAKLKELEGLQKKLTEDPSDSSLLVQIRAAYLALNREIAAQQDLYGSDGSNEDFYGKVADAVGAGITRDELMVYESLSGIRPYVKQAELLKSLFEGDAKAFQLIMGGGKTAVLLSLFCFYISRRNGMSVPVIFSHQSQFESVVGNVGEYQRSRFNQDIMVLDVTREQLKNQEHLQQVLNNLRAAKEKHQVIIARTSLLNVLQLTFQEVCNHSERKKMLEAQLEETKRKKEVADTRRKEALGCVGGMLNVISRPTDPRYDDPKQQKFRRARDERNALQGQMNKVREELDKYDGDNEKFKLLRDILGFFKTETTGIFDEADMNLNVMEEVNFPSGHEEPISETQRAAGASFFRHIAALNKSKGNDFDLFGLSKNEQAMLNDSQFQEQQNLLAEHIWNQNISLDEPMTWKDFMEPRGIGLEDFKKILRGEDTKAGVNPFAIQSTAPRPGEDESVEYAQEKGILERLAIFRGLMSELLPHTRSKSANRNYGFAIHEVPVPTTEGAAPKMARKPFFVPYVAVGQPSQNAFGNPYEKMACFYMHAMHNEELAGTSDTSLVFSNATGSAQLLDLFFDKMKGKIELERSLISDGVQMSGKTLEDLFRETTGLEYAAFKEAINKRDLGQSEEYNGLLKSAQQHLAHNPNARLLLFEYVSDEFLKCHPSMTTSGSMQVTELVGDCMACSGTVWNHRTWPTVLGENLKQDVGTEGQILIKQKQDFKAGRAKTFVAESAEVESVLDSIGNEADLKNFRALIDSGGIFKTSNAETVARKILGWVEKKNADNIRIDVDGVLFFRPHEDRPGGTYCIMSAKDKTIHVLAGTTKNEIRSAGFDPNKIVVYYDEARTVGTDVQFDPTAFAVQTNDPSSTSLRDLSQGSMRMRQLLNAQKVHIVCARTHLEAKRKSDGVAGKTADSFTFEEVLKWGTENQAAKLQKQQMKAHKAKIDGIIKNIIFETIQNAEISHGDACNIYNAFVDFFQKETLTDAIAMFTANKTKRDGADEIEQHLRTQVEKFNKVLNDRQNLPRLDEIRNRMVTAQMDQGALARALKVAKEDLGGEMFEANARDTDVEIDQERDVDQEQEQEVDQEQEQEVDQEQDIDLNYAGNSTSPRAREEENIDVSVDLKSSHFAHFTNFDSVSASEDLKVIPTNRRFSSGPAIKNYGELLPGHFHVSRNFREVAEGNTHPFSPLRNEPYYFVLHIKGDGEHEFCVVSHREAKTMQEKLNGDNTFLFDIHGALLKGNQTQAERFNVQKEDAINWIHFWHGDIEALQSASSTWINDNLKRNDPARPLERSNHEICCFRWLLARANHRNKANGSEKANDGVQAVHKIFKSAGVGSELQAEAGKLLAELTGVSAQAPRPAHRPTPAPKPAQVPRPVSVSRTYGSVEEPQRILQQTSKKLQTVINKFDQGNDKRSTLSQICSKVKQLEENITFIEGSKLAPDIQEVVDFMEALSTKEDDELARLINNSHPQSTRAQDIFYEHFKSLCEACSVPDAPRLFWTNSFKGIKSDARPAPAPAPMPPSPAPVPVPVSPRPAPAPAPAPMPPRPAPMPPRPAPVPVVSSVGDRKQAIEFFETIISEISVRQANTSIFQKFFAALRAWWYGTNIDVELAKKEIQINSGSGRVTTLGKRYFKQINDQENFLRDSFEYIRDHSSSQPEDTKFLLYFCKEDILSLAKQDIAKAETLARIISEGITSLPDSRHLQFDSELYRVIKDIEKH